MTTAEKVLESIPLVIGIIICVFLFFKIGKAPSGVSRGIRDSELEELDSLSDDDYIRVSDMSEKKSVKVKLSTLKKFIIS